MARSVLSLTEGFRLLFNGILINFSIVIISYHGTILSETCNFPHYLGIFQLQLVHQSQIFVLFPLAADLSPVTRLAS